MRACMHAHVAWPCVCAVHAFAGTTSYSKAVLTHARMHACGLLARRAHPCGHVHGGSPTRAVVQTVRDKLRSVSMPAHMDAIYGPRKVWRAPRSIRDLSKPDDSNLMALATEASPCSCIESAHHLGLQSTPLPSPFFAVWRRCVCAYRGRPLCPPAAARHTAFRSHCVKLTTRMSLTQPRNAHRA